MRLIFGLVAPFLISGLIFAQTPAAPAEAQSGSRLARVKRVYILTMRNSMDQFLASRLTSMNVFEVVVDPKVADAVITDNVGAGFQDQLKELYPPVVEEKPKDKDKDKDKDEDTDQGTTTKEVGAKMPLSTFSRGRGTSIFVVDPKTASVLWSVYTPPNKSSQIDAEKTSKTIAEAMQNEMKPKKKSKGASSSNQ